MFFNHYIFNVYYWIVYVNHNTNAYSMFVSWTCYKTHNKLMELVLNGLQ